MSADHERPDVLALVDIANAAQAYHRACHQWDAAMDADDVGTLDRLEVDIPTIRQRLWDALASVVSAESGAS